MKLNIELDDNDMKELLEFNNESIQNIIDALQFKKYKKIIKEIESDIIRPLRRGKYSINGMNLDSMDKEGMGDAIVRAFEEIIISNEEN